MAEEKDVAGITNKLHEAKSHKSNETCEIVGTFASAGSTVNMIVPFKKVINFKHYQVTHFSTRAPMCMCACLERGGFCWRVNSGDS